MAPMPVDRSELSSIVGLIEQVTERVGRMAEGALAERDDGVATELFGVERELTGARRRLDRLLSAR